MDYTETYLDSIIRSQFLIGTVLRYTLGKSDTIVYDLSQFLIGTVLQDNRIKREKILDYIDGLNSS